MNWSKELWFALLFLTVGFTIWPLLVYYLGLAMAFDFFLSTTLRVWAEDIVYGPIGKMNLSTLRSLLFLCFPYFAFSLLRLILKKNSSSV